jgi:uncharacterized membrane protein YccF (DUF307 family)
MSAGMNFLWFLLGGLITGIAWYIVGCVATLTVVGLPWARSCFMLGNFSFAPFGRDVIDRETLKGRRDLGTGNIGCVGNAVWFIFAGWWLAVLHLISAAVSAITIIGIPFAVQHLKLAGASLFPVGKTVVSKELAGHARQQHAAEVYRSYRRR